MCLSSPTRAGGRILCIHWYNLRTSILYGGRLNSILTYLNLFLTTSIVIGLDQFTKALVRAHIPLGHTWLPQGWEWLEPYARFVHWYNTGAAFGMFQGFGWVFTILAFVVAALIIYYYPQVHPEDWWLRLAMGLQLGGALGNVIDRLIFNGRVTDFISVGAFPVFNVADSSITIGVLILLLGVWYKEILLQKPVSAETKPTEEHSPQPSAEETRE
ncbi:MAG: signal peptidase II [Anaerolineae bacterium]|nr:MAG: signal peptidase II [Anaerolineae bacterium]